MKYIASMHTIIRHKLQNKRTNAYGYAETIILSVFIIKFEAFCMRIP